jgi:serine/threonine protein phosphatase PrpC
LKVNEIKEGRIKSYSYYSLAGKNIEGFQKINQDSYLILPNINNHKDFNIFCIFDGHGQEGQFISNFVSKYFSNFFKNDEKLNSKKNN